MKLRRDYECSLDEHEPEPKLCCSLLTVSGEGSIRTAVCGCGGGVTETLGQRIYTDSFGTPYAWRLVR